MKPKPIPYRLAIAVAVGTSLLLIWLSMGVGLIGRDGDPANRMYSAVVAVGVFGAIVSRVRPIGMARTLVAMAFLQAAIGAYAALAGLGRPWSGALELMGLSSFFVILFIGSAWLFRRSGLT